MLQVFADGRCGYAIDGKAVYVSRTSVLLPDSARVIIDGNSVGTRILVGAVQAGVGIRSDIDWRRVDGKP